MKQLSKNYDLKERTSAFGEKIIELCREVSQNVINKPIINQLIRSGTSIGANYMEANNACSKRDFRNKIFICKKECEETKHWLRMLTKAYPIKDAEIKILWDECQQLTMIFQKITNSLRDSKL